ncbi:hypothetical protein JR338_05175 [Chloroflexota bacterium]|nr:hypothetical protein JR338_05175 [Chloroflexota bacterium]
MDEHIIFQNLIGRKSGTAHQSVVRVVSNDADSDTYFASSWGYKSECPRNLLSHPQIDVQIGKLKLLVDVRSLAPEQGANVLLDYRQRQTETDRQGQGPIWGINLMEEDFTTLQVIVRDKVPMFDLLVQQTACG